MIETNYHDRLIARLQHFANYLTNTRNDLELNAFALQDEIKMLREMKLEIKTYNKIIEEYDAIFSDILFK